MLSKELNVCITTVGGLTSPDVIKACRNINNYKVNIVGVDPYEYAVGRYFCDYFEVVPSSSDNELDFVETINHIVKKYDINILIPCGNEDNIALSKNINLIQNNVNVLVSEYSSLKKAFDKGLVYKETSKYKNIGVDFFIVNSYEEFTEKISVLGFPDEPVVVKPAFGRGGRGVYILKDKPDYNLFNIKPYNFISLDFIEKLYKNKNVKSLIVMEFLDEPFYSVYSLSKDGENLVSLCHTREWGNASQTYRGIIEYREEIDNIASTIISDFKLSYFVNMELGISKRDKNIKIFDLNPRIGASTAISFYYGFNFLEYGVKLALGELNIDIRKLAKEIFKNPKRFVRYFDAIKG